MIPEKEKEIRIVKRGFIYTFFELIFKAIIFIFKALTKYKIMRWISFFFILLMIYIFILNRLFN